MTFSTWIAYVLVMFLCAISPGSGAVLSMSHGLSYGVRRASATILGLQCGLLLVFFIAGAGVGSLLLASSLAFTIVKTAGALYLIYLGIAQWRARPDAAHGPAAQAAPMPLRRRVLTGFLTNATNPKGIVFMVAVLPQFITHDAPLLPQLAILAATSVAIDVCVMHGYALLASSMQRFFRNAQALRAQNRFFGGILVAVGGALFFVKRGAAAA